MSDPEDQERSVSSLAVPAVSHGLGPDREEFRFALPVGLGAVLAAMASLATCYSGILTSYVFGFEGGGINPHFQAFLMWGFALLAALFLWRDRSRHRNYLPLAIGGLSVLILVVTLYLGYDERIEALAYILLVIAALLNQILLLEALNRTVRSQAHKIDALNQSLTDRVELQENQIDRLGRLKQFLAPQVAELVVAEGNDEMLNTHRRFIACLFVTSAISPPFQRPSSQRMSSQSCKSSTIVLAHWFQIGVVRLGTDPVTG